MTEKHRSAEYRRNARTLRRRVGVLWAQGEPVRCWRGGGAIVPGQPYDIGHIDPHGGEGLGNLAAEHRRKVDGCCQGNRAHGGALGAAITNNRRTNTRSEEVEQWAL